jgi:hypothetical protein
MRVCVCITCHVSLCCGLTRPTTSWQKRSRTRLLNTDYHVCVCVCVYVSRATCQIDTSYNELAKELHNGRLFRLLTKLNMIVERPQVSTQAVYVCVCVRVCVCVCV